MNQPSRPDQAALARLDREIRRLSAELAAPESYSQSAPIFAKIQALQSERETAARTPRTAESIDREEALDYLNDLGRLWRATTDEGRKTLAGATFSRLGAVMDKNRALHDRRSPPRVRITQVELTEHAERRGLVLALPARLEVVMVGDTGLEPVTSCMSAFPPERCATSAEGRA